MVGIGHLCPKPADVTDPRRLPRMWSAFVSKIEEKYGSSGLYPRLRKVSAAKDVREVQHSSGRLNMDFSRMQRGYFILHELFVKQVMI